ncbi:10678_t:CDS:1, partial [Acaulospora colombiana]
MSVLSISMDSVDFSRDSAERDNRLLNCIVNPVDLLLVKLST